MTQKPRLLDLFCGPGGAAAGYQEAGFYVVGVDINPQPNYCGDEFWRGDALNGIIAGDWDAIHASPPCQGYSVTRFRHPHIEYPDLIARTRELLRSTGLPYVIENVPGAPLDPERTQMLCGVMFPELRVYRHRLFETTFCIAPPEHTKHPKPVWPQHRRGATEDDYITVTGDSGRRLASKAMGIGWMTGNELSQAIPPAYTRHIGRELMRVIAQKQAA